MPSPEALREVPLTDRGMDAIDPNPAFNNIVNSLAPRAYIPPGAAKALEQTYDNSLESWLNAVVIESDPNAHPVDLIHSKGTVLAFDSTQGLRRKDIKPTTPLGEAVVECVRVAAAHSALPRILGADHPALRGFDISIVTNNALAKGMLAMLDSGIGPDAPIEDAFRQYVSERGADLVQGLAQVYGGVKDEIPLAVADLNKRIGLAMREARAVREQKALPDSFSSLVTIMQSRLRFDGNDQALRDDPDATLASWIRAYQVLPDEGANEMTVKGRATTLQLPQSSISCAINTINVSGPIESTTIGGAFIELASREAALQHLERHDPDNPVLRGFDAPAAHRSIRQMKGDLMRVLDSTQVSAHTPLSSVLVEPLGTVSDTTRMVRRMAPLTVAATTAASCAAPPQPAVETSVTTVPGFIVEAATVAPAAPTAIPEPTVVPTETPLPNQPEGTEVPVNQAVFPGSINSLDSAEVINVNVLEVNPLAENIQAQYNAVVGIISGQEEFKGWKLVTDQENLKRDETVAFVHPNTILADNQLLLKIIDNGGGENGRWAIVGMTKIGDFLRFQEINPDGSLGKVHDRPDDVSGSVKAILVNPGFRLDKLTDTDDKNKNGREYTYGWVFYEEFWIPAAWNEGAGKSGPQIVAFYDHVHQMWKYDFERIKPQSVFYSAAGEKITLPKEALEYVPRLPEDSLQFNSEPVQDGFVLRNSVNFTDGTSLEVAFVAATLKAVVKHTPYYNAERERYLLLLDVVNSPDRHIFLVMPEVIDPKSPNFAGGTIYLAGNSAIDELPNPINSLDSEGVLIAKATGLPNGELVPFMQQIVGKQIMIGIYLNVPDKVLTAPWNQQTVAMIKSLEEGGISKEGISIPLEDSYGGGSFVIDEGVFRAIIPK